VRRRTRAYINAYYRKAHGDKRAMPEFRKKYGSLADPGDAVARSVIKVLTRLDWIRSRLEAGKPFNAVDVIEKFRVSHKTVMRDIAVIRSYYRMDVRFNVAEKTYYLND